MFNTARHLRRYLSGIDNKEISKAIDIIVQKQPLINAILKAVGKKAAKISPSLVKYCMRLYMKFFKWR